jgi:hypothetical protein
MLLLSFMPSLMVFSKNTVAPSAIFFSLIVFVIWSFIPVLGYLFAKVIGAKGYASKVVLFIAGIVIALIENALTYFYLLKEQQYTIATVIVFLLFFLLAYLPINKLKQAKTS